MRKRESNHKSTRQMKDHAKLNELSSLSSHLNQTAEQDLDFLTLLQCIKGLITGYCVLNFSGICNKALDSML